MSLQKESNLRRVACDALGAADHVRGQMIGERVSQDHLHQAPRVNSIAQWQIVANLLQVGCPKRMDQRDPPDFEYSLQDRELVGEANIELMTIIPP